MTRPVTFLLAPLALLAACHSDRPPAEPPAPMPAPATTPAPARTATPAAASMTTTGVYVDPSLASLCGIAQPRVFFTYDSASVASNDMSTLQSLVQCASSGPLKGKSLDIVGRADPRGDDEYNKQLGQSRADAVAAALSSRGVDRAMLQTRSTGEDRATGSDEHGWARDRRVDIRLSNGSGAGTGSAATSGAPTSGASGSGASTPGASGASGTTPKNTTSGQKNAAAQ